MVTSDALIPSNRFEVLSGLPVPFFIVNPSKAALITISGVVELSYACCSVVVDIPSAPPHTTPNFETR